MFNLPIDCEYYNTRPACCFYVQQIATLFSALIPIPIKATMLIIVSSCHSEQKVQL